MSAEQYYLRFRGRISGPFDLAQLREKVLKGTCSRIHEVSADRVNWVTADTIAELFPAAGRSALSGRRSTAGRGQAERVERTGQSREVVPPAARSDDTPFYRQVGGEAVPATLGGLRSLAQRGELRPDDLVWSEGFSDWMRAQDVPELSAAFGAQPTAASLVSGATEEALDDGYLIPFADDQPEVESVPETFRPAVVAPRVTSAEYVDTPIEVTYAYDPTGGFSISFVLSVAWEITKHNYGALLGATLLYGLVALGIGLLNVIPFLGTLVSLIINPVINAGYMFIGVQAYRTGEARSFDIGRAFDVFGKILGIAYLRLVILFACFIPFVLASGVAVAVGSSSERGSLMFAILAGLGGLISLVLALGVGLRLMFSEPIGMETGMGVVGCMQRSWSLTSPVAGKLLLLIIVIMVAMVGLPVAFLLAGGGISALVGRGSAGSIGAGVLGALLLWAGTTFFVGIPYMLSVIGAAYGLATHNTEDLALGSAYVE